MVIVLIVITSFRPNKSSVSEFEMHRLIDQGNKPSIKNWRRYEYYHDVLTLRRIVVTCLLVVVTVFAVRAFDWTNGIIVALLVAIFYVKIALSGFVHRPVQRLYDKFETRILMMVEHISRWLRIIGGAVDPDPDHVVSSREELVHLIDGSGLLLTKSEATLLKSGLSFEGKLVKDYMTPRSMMEAIGANELLGPLTLDNLYKTGHTHFPVMDRDIDHLVGILHIYSLFTLENKKSVMVRDVMEPRVFYIHEDQSLEDALAACIKYRRHLLVVVNSYRETVGVITIEDAVEQLIGRKIVDQFAEHDDLRKVAARNPRGNNAGKSRVDV